MRYVAICPGFLWDFDGTRFYDKTNINKWVMMQTYAIYYGICSALPWIFVGFRRNSFLRQN